MAEGLGVALGLEVGAAVFEGVKVGMRVEVLVALTAGVRVGGSPINTNVPDAFHSVPTKIWTSYVPGRQSSAGCAQSVSPTPAAGSVHDLVSKYFRSPSRYQRAVHCTPGSSR
jgi:hypothetical protein